MTDVLTTDMATAIEERGTYVRNMCALWRHDARLAMAVEGVHPEDVPEVEAAKDGAWTVKVGGGGTMRNAEGGIRNGNDERRTMNDETGDTAHESRLTNHGSRGAVGVYLHSRYRPVQEAEAWAEGQKVGDRYAVAVSGFGLGHHVKALFEKMPEDALLVVGEPNLGVLKAGLRAVDCAEMLGSGRVMIFTSLDRGVLVERLEPRSALFTAGAGMLLASHPASVQVAPGFHSPFQKLILEFISFTRTGFITLMLNNVTTCRNIANNMGRYVTTPPIDLMRDAYKGKPAVLVAAGPSLAKNMHLLNEVVGNAERGTRNAEGETGDEDVRRSAFGVQRSAVIIAVQTMLKPLLAAGVEPDFVTSLDYNTVSTRFFENLEESAGGRELKRVHLVAQPTANWNVLDVFSGAGGGGGVGGCR